MFLHFKDFILNQHIKIFRLVLILFVGFLVWFLVPCPLGLEMNAWQMLIIFVSSMIALMFEVGNSTAVLLIFLLVASLTKTIETTQGFSGFAGTVPWFLFFVLSLSKAITNSSIGQRIASMIVILFGKNMTTLSYSIPLVELLTAPLIPSNTARAASIGSPIVSSLAKNISENIKNASEKDIGGYFAMLYRYSNAICSGLFLTGMVSNIIINEAAAKIGIQLTWLSWFGYVVFPAVTMLLILPFVLKFLCRSSNSQASKKNDLHGLKAVLTKEYKNLGPLLPKEKITICIFVAMLLLWIFSGYAGISVLTATLLGLVVFLLFEILSIEELVSSKNTWNAVLTMGFLISFVDSLIKLGVIDWFNNIISHSMTFQNHNFSLIMLGSVYFLARYFFTGEGAGVIALYTPFLLTGISLGIDKLQLAMTLAVFSSLGVALTHYSSPVSMTMASLGYVSVRRWLTVGFVLSVVFVAIWYGYLWGLAKYIF